MSMPHTCRCGVCGAEMGWTQAGSRLLPCLCVGGNCCFDNQAPNTGILLGGAYCRKARGELATVDGGVAK